MSISSFEEAHGYPEGFVNAAITAVVCLEIYAGYLLACLPECKLEQFADDEEFASRWAEKIDTAYRWDIIA